MTTVRQVEVLLIPAGPTGWDAEHRLAGSADIPLAPTAIADLRRGLASFSTQPARVVCGPEEACKGLAKVAAGKWGRSFKSYADLRELGLGLWEGMRVDEAQQRYASAFAAWRDDPASALPPEGETLDHAKSRLLSTTSAIMSRLKSGQVLAIVVRPMAAEIVQAALEQRPITDLPESVDRMSIRHLVVPGDRLREYRPAVIRTFLV